MGHPFKHRIGQFFSTSMIIADCVNYRLINHISPSLKWYKYFSFSCISAWGGVCVRLQYNNNMEIHLSLFCKLLLKYYVYMTVKRTFGAM